MIPSEANLEYDPDWSPDGSLLAFVSLRRRRLAVWTGHPDGSDRRLLAATPLGEHDPEWSRDGRRIAFSELGGPSGGTVGIMRSDGSRPHVVIPGSDPAWSPYGNW